MKIIHCADIHADSKMGTHFTKEQADTRRKEVVAAFSNMVKYAVENEAKVIIIAGDLFDTKETHQKTIKKQIAYIISQNPQIDFLYLRGNHDEDVEFAAQETDDVPNLKRFSKDDWTKYSYENVDIYGHEFGSAIPIGAYSELAPDASRVNIVTLHGQVSDYVSKDGAPVISLPRLKDLNLDYIALGHIHEYKLENLDNRCSWCYSGCLEGRGFDECGEKGFVVIDVQGNKVKTEFISQPVRTIHEINVNLESGMTFAEILNEIKAATEKIPVKDIIQVVLKGEISEDTEIDISAYETMLQSSHFYVRIKDKTEAKIDYKKYENDVSLKGEFIRIVNSQADLSEEQKAKIIMTGIKALAGSLN